MLDSNSMLLLIPLFIVAYSTIWTGVCHLIASMSGWKKLAEAFGSEEEPQGEAFNWQTGRLGWASYNNVLHAVINDHGLHLRVNRLFVGHRPLFIPWAYIQVTPDQKKFGQLWLTLEISHPATTTHHHLNIYRFFRAHLYNAIRTRYPAPKIAIPP